MAIDHLTTWYRLIFELRAMPAQAHHSLLRPSQEGAVQARWVLDPSEGAQTRVRRALSLALDDLDELRKLEDEMIAGGWTPTRAYRHASDRAASMRSAATSASLALPTVTDTTSLLRKYQVSGGPYDVIAFRITSGVIHAKAWTAFLEQVEVIKPGATVSTMVTTANQELATGLTITAVEHVDSAVRTFEAYLESTLAGAAGA